MLLYDNQAGTGGWDIFATAKRSEQNPPQSPCHNCEGRCRNFLNFSVFVNCVVQRNEAVGHNSSHLICPFMFRLSVRPQPMDTQRESALNVRPKRRCQSWPCPGTGLFPRSRCLWCPRQGCTGYTWSRMVPHFSNHYGTMAYKLLPGRGRISP